MPIRFRIPFRSLDLHQEHVALSPVLFIFVHVFFFSRVGGAERTRENVSSVYARDEIVLEPEKDQPPPSFCPPLIISAIFTLFQTRHDN